jgi:hypothetical protein
VNDDTETSETVLTFRGRGGAELTLPVYARPLLFDLRLSEALGSPSTDASSVTQALHWSRLGVIFAAEGLRPGRTDIPALPAFNAPGSTWWAYADEVAALFSGWGLTERAVLRLRKASDALSGWGEALDAEGKG